MFLFFSPRCSWCLCKQNQRASFFYGPLRDHFNNKSKKIKVKLRNRTMSEVFLYSSFSQGSYLICDKQRRNSTRSSFQDVSWLTMIGFFGINHHDFLQLKESSLFEMYTVMIENQPHHLASSKLMLSFVKTQNLLHTLTWKYTPLYPSLNKMWSLCDVI